MGLYKRHACDPLIPDHLNNGAFMARNYPDHIDACRIINVHAEQSMFYRCGFDDLTKNIG
jgi:hypothetical protein